MNEDSVKGWGEPGRFVEGQGSVQWSREIGMRWGEGREPGLDHDTDTDLYPRSNTESQKAWKGDMLSEFRKKILCCTHKAH